MRYIKDMSRTYTMESDFEDNSKIYTTNNTRQVKSLWLPFVRQLSIAIGLWTIYFLNGVLIGIPTVVVPQLRRELNGTTKFNEDLSPWLYSVFGIGGTPWVFIIPVLLELIGRKFTFMVICVVTFIGYVIFYSSNSVVQILISELILGILVTASQTVLAVILTEYTAPKYRGIFLTFKSASFLWGIWVANATGTFLHWKNIGILAFVCCTYTLTVSMWPESPYWLATKGKFIECAAAHRWLKGTSFESEQELTKLVESQKLEKNKSTVRNKPHIGRFFANITKIIVLPEFYKPILVSMLVLVQYYISGKMVCSMFAIDIIKRITDSESAAYKTMLILDGITVASAYIGSITSKFLSRRTLLILTTSIAVLMLFTLSLYLYLIKLCIFIENNIISISILIVYSIGISSGCMILATSIIGEVLPLRFKSWSILVLALFGNIIHFSTLRIAPVLFKLLGLHGTFLFYGAGSLICLCLVYIYLPETKDKTLQEIEECFKRSSPTPVEESTQLVNNPSRNTP